MVVNKPTSGFASPVYWNRISVSMDVWETALTTLACEWPRRLPSLSIEAQKICSCENFGSILIALAIAIVMALVLFVSRLNSAQPPSKMRVIDGKKVTTPTPWGVIGGVGNVGKTVDAAVGLWTAEDSDDGSELGCIEGATEGCDEGTEDSCVLGCIEGLLLG
jgi:hypothetical protein